MVYENNEEKRSTLWRTVVTVSSVLIIIIAVFFLVKLFTANPVKGTWISEDSGEVLDIRDNGVLTVTPPDGNSEGYKAQYTIDTKTKILTIQSGSTAASEGVLSGSYNYSVDQDTLTLLEREYGDQFIFVRK